MFSNRQRRIGWLSLLSLTGLLLGCLTVDQPGLTQHGGDVAPRMPKRNVVPEAVARLSSSASSSSLSSSPAASRPLANMAGAKTTDRAMSRRDPKSIVRDSSSPFRRPSSGTQTNGVVSVGAQDDSDRVAVAGHTKHNEVLVDPAFAERSASDQSGSNRHAFDSSEHEPSGIRQTSAPLQLPPPAPAAGDSKAGNEPALLDTPVDAQPIDLSTTLALVAGRNPRVAFVQERVREAWARVDAAEALWLPSLRAGVSYNKHEGSIQEVGGDVFNVSRGSLYSGFGAQAVGTGSPAVSGLSARFHLADAFFQPMIARRTVGARQHRVNAVTNDELLAAALAHVDLVQAVSRKRIALETLKHLRRLAKLTASFAERGQGTRADADRAQTELKLQQNRVTRTEEQIRIAAARLAERINLDEEITLRPAELTVVPVDLVPADSDVSSLMTQAVANRPEMSENRLQISAAVNRWKRERYSPFVPNVGLGVSYGGFGGGEGDTVTHYRDRFDLDAVLYWEVRNLGFGERAARDAAHSRMHQARFRRAQLLNRIRREVAEAHARLTSARRQLRVAAVSVRSAEDSYRRNMQRIREGEGLPLEVLQSVQALNAAKEDRLNAKAAYNRAQFQLYRALGWPVEGQNRRARSE